MIACLFGKIYNHAVIKLQVFIHVVKIISHVRNLSAHTTVSVNKPTVFIQE